MKVKTFKGLINKLMPVVDLMFRTSIQSEFPKLLNQLQDDGDIPLKFFQTPSKSLSLLNMFGVLCSVRYDFKVKKNKNLLEELNSVIESISKEFPSLTANEKDEKEFSKIEDGPSHDTYDPKNDDSTSCKICS